MKSIVTAALIVAIFSVPAIASDTSIIQKDQSFSQLAVSVSAGDTVRWGNIDDVAHNISIKGPSGDPLDLGEQAHGVILAHKFEKAGIYKVYCKIHPRMKMTVTVQ